MDLLSAFKRKTPPVAAPAEAADEVQRARTRARQRLIGAAVLVVAGIIGFPLLFETQPRPIPVDMPIEIPRKDGAPPLAMPAPPPPQPVASGSVGPAAAPVERVINETAAEAGREVSAAPVATPAEKAASAAASHPTASTAALRASAPASEAKAPEVKVPVAKAAEAARAQALLEGRPVPEAASDGATSTGRFVVQVGAFADATSAREARAKVEKLGLKTYTQVAETPAGPRTRVRVGPFATRAEAERAAAKIKSAELPAAILTL